MLKKAVCVGLAAAMLALVGCGGNKQANNETSKVKWPKNVEIIVPYGAGGDTDFNARLLAQKLSKKLGSNFVVSNVTGNGGATGSRKVKDGKKDGSMISFSITPLLSSIKPARLLTSGLMIFLSHLSLV